MTIQVATCQFPVDADIRRNTRYVLRPGVQLMFHSYHAGHVTDSTVAWRGRAMRGVLHSGSLVRDRRSDERRKL